MSTRFLRLIAYYVLMGWLSFEALAARQSFRDDSFGAFMLLCLVTLVPWFLLWAEPPRFSGLRGRASPLRTSRRRSSSVKRERRAVIDIGLSLQAVGRRNRQ